MAAAVAAAVVAVAAEASHDSWHDVWHPGAQAGASYPDGWFVQRFGHHCRRIGPGFVVRNTPDYAVRYARPPGICTSERRLTDAPAALVAVELTSVFVPHCGWGPVRRRLAAMRLLRRGSFSVRFAGGVDPGRERCYWVRVYFGPLASRLDRQIAERIVASIRFSR